MKKTSVFLRFYPFFVVFLLLLGCNKKHEVDITSDENINVEKIKLGSMIKTIAVGLIEVSKNKGFRELVNAEVNKQFDNDFNVLLKTLDDKYAEKGNNLINQIQNSISINNKALNEQERLKPTKYSDLEIYSEVSLIEEAIAGFDFKNDILYTQVYIPFIEIIDLQSQPVIAIAVEDECETIGYQVSPNGDINTIKVTEEFAKNNLVWVISINESVDSKGNLPPALIPEGNDSTSLEYRHHTNKVKIESVLIAEKKECWLCGKADVSLIIQYVNYGGCVNVAYVQKPTFIKIGNSQLGEWCPVNTTLIPGIIQEDGAGPVDCTAECGWILFEKDTGSSMEIQIPGCSYTYFPQTNDEPWAIESYFNMDGCYSDFVWHTEGPYYSYYPGYNPYSGIKFSAGSASH